MTIQYYVPTLNILFGRNIEILYFSFFNIKCVVFCPRLKFTVLLFKNPQLWPYSVFFHLLYFRSVMILTTKQIYLTICKIYQERMVSHSCIQSIGKKKLSFFCVYVIELQQYHELLVNYNIDWFIQSEFFQNAWFQSSCWEDTLVPN